MRKSVLILAGITGAAMLSGSAHANLVTDPGFEANYMSGGSLSQTYSNPTGYTVSGDVGSDNSNPHTGNMDGFLGSGTLSQSILTSIGHTYSVTFYVAEDSNLYNSADATDSLAVSFGSGGDTINGFTDARITGPGAYFADTFSVIASTTTTVLSFTATEPTIVGNFLLDDLDVECTNCAIAQVPEPTPLWLYVPAFLGFMAYGIVRRNRSSI